MERKGTVAQVLGPVVDVEFSEGSLPEINEALTVELDGKAQVMEVAQHIGGDTVRCIMLSPSEGLGRGVGVTATGHTIQTPVGEGTLGRMFNVLGEPIDGKGAVDGSERWSIHRDAPSFCPAKPHHGTTGNRHQGHRPACPLCQRREDWPVWRRGRWENGADPRADPTTSPQSMADIPFLPVWESAPGRGMTCGGR